MNKIIQSFYKLSLLSLVTFITVMMGCSKHVDMPVTENAALRVALITPSRGPSGTVVTLEGVGFSASSANDSVYFKGLSTPATILSATSSQLAIVVPEGGSTGSVMVHVNGLQATGPVFTYGRPLLINSYSPNGGPAGINDTIRGTGFGTSLSSVAVTFNEVSANVLSVNDSMVVAIVPAKAGLGKVKVIIDRQQVVQGPVFNFMAITSLSPSEGVDGSRDTIIGTGFSSTLSQDSVKYNGTPATLISASPTMLVAVVPASSGTGQVSVTINGMTAVGPVFTNNSPAIGTISPLSGPVNAMVTITGVGFTSLDTVFFNGAPAQSVFGNPNLIYASVPAGSSSGKIKIGASGSYLTSGNTFTVTATGVITLAGNVNQATMDGKGLLAEFNNVFATTVDKGGNIYTVESGDNYSYSVVRRITPDGTVSTLLNGSPDYNYFNSVTTDNKGNLFFVGYNNIAELDASGKYSVIAGDPNQNSGFADGQGTAARFSNNQGVGGIVFDKAGNLYMVDFGNSAIRKISPSGQVTTPYNAKFLQRYTPVGLAIDAQDNLYFTANNNYSSNGVFEITTDGVLHQLGGVGNITPYGITVDADGNIYFTNGNNWASAIYEYPAGATGSAPILLAGDANRSGSVDGPLAGARFSISDLGGAISTDAQGNIIVADNSNVRKIILQ